MFKGFCKNIPTDTAPRWDAVTEMTEFGPTTLTEFSPTLLVFHHTSEENFEETLAGNKKACIFAVSEMTNPVFSAWE